MTSKARFRKFEITHTEKAALEQTRLMYLMGVEFGFQEHERGSNLETALDKAAKLLRPKSAARAHETE